MPGPFLLSSPQVTLCGLINWSVRMVFIVGFIVSFIFLLVGGMRWMATGGDIKLAEGAKRAITYGITGLVVVLSAFAIVRLIAFFFSVDIISRCPGPI